MASIFFITLAILFLDRLSKIIIVNKLNYGQSIPIISNVFHLTLVHNKGAAFGILQNATLLFIAISLISIFFILYFLLFKPQYARSIWMRMALAFILAGATGNLFDRIKFGYVIDFLDFRIWPVFNLADSAISVGMFILIFQFFRKTNASDNF